MQIYLQARQFFHIFAKKRHLNFPDEMRKMCEILQIPINRYCICREKAVILQPIRKK